MADIGARLKKFAAKKEKNEGNCGLWVLAKLYTPSTLNIVLILWHIQLIVCAAK